MSNTTPVSESAGDSKTTVLARMGIVADSRFADVSDWVDSQLLDMRALSDNASLQLYMTILHGMEGDEVSAE